MRQMTGTLDDGNDCQCWFICARRITKAGLPRSWDSFTVANKLMISFGGTRSRGCTQTPVWLGRGHTNWQSEDQTLMSTQPYTLRSNSQQCTVYMWHSRRRSYNQYTSRRLHICAASQNDELAIKSEWATISIGTKLQRRSGFPGSFV